MLIRDLMNFGARPALTEAQSFAAGRHRLIINNIANMQTPNYQQQDVSVPGFQKALREIVEGTRASAT